MIKLGEAVENIIDKSIREYIENLASAEPVPGGGAVAALNGAQGMALIMMVANHTIGKKKYEEFEALNIEVRDASRELLNELIAGVDADARAFREVASAYALPKDTEEDRAVRSEAISIASVDAALVPLACIRNAYSGIQLCAKLIGKSNINLLSDLYVSAFNLNACIQAAKYNVDANLTYFSDSKYAESLANEANIIVEKANRALEEITKEAKQMI